MAILVALVAALSWGSATLVYGQGAAAQSSINIVEENVRIPGRAGNYSIAATIVRPDFATAGDGPYGAMILNHGTPVSALERARESTELLLETASIFARRGYVVVLPLRRGFGLTGGDFAEDAGSCANPDFRRGESAAAEDVMAAYDYARTLPYVDASRMILAGQSAGGVASMYAAAARHPQGLVAVLAFAAGRGGNPRRTPGVPCAVEPLARVFDEMGKSIRVPVLFHYAENDRFFNAETSRLWFDRFTAGGARADYVLQPAFGADGHYIFSDARGVRYWLPAVERFLGKYGVPFAELAPAAPAAAPATVQAVMPRPVAPTGEGLIKANQRKPAPLTRDSVTSGSN
jgi:dienelactone hydrolase